MLSYETYFITIDVYLMYNNVFQSKNYSKKSCCIKYIIIHQVLKVFIHRNFDIVTYPQIYLIPIYFTKRFLTYTYDIDIPINLFP